MHWKLRAQVLRALAAVPGGHAVYQLLQRRFGYFRHGDYIHNRLAKQRELAASVIEHGGRVEGGRVVEVGTGWVPLMPLGFWICGAESVVTFDLNRYLLPKLVERCCAWMSAHRGELVELWGDLQPVKRIEEKLDAVDRLRDRPYELLRHAGIEYRAPADAAATALPDASIDLHASANVFEHIPLDTVREILGEAHRILRPGGLAVHNVDPSDHFAHNDPSISRINFLRLDEAAWRRYYGNRYSYLNRCHDSDYRRAFEEAAMALRDCRFDVDAEARALLEDGFPLDATFAGKGFEDLCRGNLTYVAAAAPSAAAADPGQ